MDHINAKTYVSVMNVLDIEQHCLSYYYISVPKENMVLLILFYIPSSKSLIQYGHVGISKSKINVLVMIYWILRKSFTSIIYLYTFNKYSTYRLFLYTSIILFTSQLLYTPIKLHNQSIDVYYMVYSGIQLTLL